MYQKQRLLATVLLNVHAEVVQLQEGPDHQTAFNLVLCAAAMGDAELMRQSFQQLLQVVKRCVWDNTCMCKLPGVQKFLPPLRNMPSTAAHPVTSLALPPAGTAICG